MSKKYDDFIKELEALCKKHEVYLCTSCCDYLQVWDLHPDDPVVIDDSQDKTNNTV